MIIFPAIDIKNGKVVRLRQGKFDEVSEYSDDPVTVAKEWVEQGAQWLHVVDLDGAKDGAMQNFDTVAAIIKAVPVKVQVGGGIRTVEDITRLIEAGAARVILGTRVVRDRDFLKDVLGLWPGQIAVSLDCSNGKVAQRGWTEVLDMKAVDFAKDMENLKLPCLIYTDIAKDGMLSGPNWEGLEEILQTVTIPVIASGGVKSPEDIQRLCGLKDQGLLGAITGRAIYEGTLNLKEAIALCSQNG